MDEAGGRGTEPRFPREAVKSGVGWGLLVGFVSLPLALAVFNTDSAVLRFLVFAVVPATTGVVMAAARRASTRGLALGTLIGWALFDVVTAGACFAWIAVEFGGDLG
ncbi:MAG: hypothetical protein M3Q27_07280 [Actinomycetota bacterium]|nr:hypothetical protein [Actinomycetota bacterium]